MPRGFFKENKADIARTGRSGRRNILRAAFLR